MITLDTTKTLSGKAGTATAITYSIYGDEVATATDAFKLLAQGQLAGTTGTLYTVPASTQTLIKEIHLANTTGSNVSSVTFYINGTASANVMWQGAIPANGSATYSDQGWRIYDSNGVVQSVGTTGPSGTITVGTVTNIGTSGPPTVTNVGTSTAAVFNFGLQQGATGLTGAPGAVNAITSTGGSIAVTGTTTTNVEVQTIPNATPASGDILFTNITAPATPASGKTMQYVDSTSKNMASKNDTGTVNHGIQTRTATASNWIRAIADDGSTTISQPAASDVTGLAAVATSGSATDLSAGTLAVGRLPAFTGDATEAIGTGVTKVVAIQNQPVNSTTPSTSNILQYNSSNQWSVTPDAFYNIVNYGADPTGTTNSYTAIQNAINAAQIAAYTGTSGAIVWFPPGRYLIGTTLSVTGNNITLMGAGGGASADFGNYSYTMASELVPQSAIKAVVVSPVLTNGLSGVPNYGFKWKGLGVDNYANGGTYGLQMISCQNFDIDDFYEINSATVGLDFNTLPASFLNGAVTLPLSGATVTVNSTAANGSGPAFNANTNTAGSFCLIAGAGSTTPGQVVNVTYTGGTATTFTGCTATGTGTFATATSFARMLPGAQDCTRGRIGQANFRQVDGSGASGHAIQLNGDGGGVGNTCINEFVGPLKIFHVNGNGINDINSDTNLWEMGTIARPSGSGAGAMIGAGSTNAFASRNNVFNHWSFGAGGFIARGTPTNTFPSGPTRVMNYQLANGEALPTVEAGALLEVNFNGAFKVGSLTAPSTTAQALTAATVNQLNNSKFVVPPNGFQVGTHLMWSIPLNKTAVGTSWLFNIRYGTGAVSTGAILQTVTYTATAVADGGVLELHCIINALGSGTSATNVGYARLSHNLGLTGLATGVTTPAGDATGPASFVYTRPTFAGFDSTLPNQGTPQFISVEINPVTASTVMNTQPGVQAFCLAQSSF